MQFPKKNFHPEGISFDDKGHSFQFVYPPLLVRQAWTLINNYLRLPNIKKNWRADQEKNNYHIRSQCDTKEAKPLGLHDSWISFGMN